MDKSNNHRSILEPIQKKVCATRAQFFSTTPKKAQATRTQFYHFSTKACSSVQYLACIILFNNKIAF